MNLRLQLKILFFITLIIGCKSNTIIDSKNKTSKIEFIELVQNTDTTNSKVKIYPSYYIVTNFNKDYKYPLEEKQWYDLLEQISIIDYKNMDDIISPSSDDLKNGRFNITNLKSVIKIKDNKNIYQTKSFDSNANLNELENLYKSLESFLPQH